MNTRSLDNLENIKGMGGAQGGASLATIQGVIEENPFGKHKGGSKRVQNLSKIESRNTI